MGIERNNYTSLVTLKIVAYNLLRIFKIVPSLPELPIRFVSYFKVFMVSAVKTPSKADYPYVIAFLYKKMC